MIQGRSEFSESEKSLLGFCVYPANQSAPSHPMKHPQPHPCSLCPRRPPAPEPPRPSTKHLFATSKVPRSWAHPHLTYGGGGPSFCQNCLDTSEHPRGQQPPQLKLEEQQPAQVSEKRVLFLLRTWLSSPLRRLQSSQGTITQFIPAQPVHSSRGAKPASSLK